MKAGIFNLDGRGPGGLESAGPETDHFLEVYLGKLRRRSNFFALEAALSDIVAGGCVFVFLLLVLPAYRSPLAVSLFCLIFVFLSLLRLRRVGSRWMDEGTAAAVLDFELASEERITTLLDYAGAEKKPFLYRRLAAEVGERLEEKRPQRLRPHRTPLSYFLTAVTVSGIFLFTFIREPNSQLARSAGPGRGRASPSPTITPAEIELKHSFTPTPAGNEDRWSPLSPEKEPGGTRAFPDSPAAGESIGGEVESLEDTATGMGAGSSTLSEAGAADDRKKTDEIPSDTSGGKPFSPESEEAGSEMSDKISPDTAERSLPDAVSPASSSSAPGKDLPRSAPSENDLSIPLVTATPSPSPTPTPLPSGRCCGGGRKSGDAKPGKKGGGTQSRRKREAGAEASPSGSPGASPAGMAVSPPAGPTPPGKSAGASSPLPAKKRSCPGKTCQKKQNGSGPDKKEAGGRQCKIDDASARAGTSPGGKGVGNAEIPETPGEGKITVKLQTGGGDPLRAEPSSAEGGETIKETVAAAKPAVKVDEDARLAAEQAGDSALEAAVIPYEYKEIIKNFLTGDNEETEKEEDHDEDRDQG